MEISGKQVKLELDTGATVTFRSLFPRRRLKHTTLELKTYTSQPLDIIGETSVQVSYQQQPSEELTLVIVKGNGPTLLCRNWLKHFRSVSRPW